MQRTLEKISNHFELAKYKTSFRTEIFAGISTFLALSYIFVVNPAILSAAGIDKSVVFLATIIGSVLATLAMGLWANKPFAVAPGLEMNAYVAYVVVGLLGFTWQGALGAVFWSGMLTVLLSFTKLRVKIIDAIPASLKTGLAAAVGVFLMLIALKVSGVLLYQGIQVKGIGALTSSAAIIFYSGLALVLVLKYFKIKGAILLSIIGASIVAHLLHATQAIDPIHLSKAAFHGLGALDLTIITNPKIWSVIIILFILDFYGSIAKFIGLTRSTNITDANGEVPKIKEALIVDGAGTVLGAATGTSNLITFVESAVGIGEGGRTGLVAVVIAVLMSLFLFLVPLVNLIPVTATTGALLCVGIMLLPKPSELKQLFWIEIIAVIAMVIVTAWTFGLDKAMFAGLAAYTILSLLTGQWKKLNRYLVISTVILLLSIILSK